jgi:hypothetical protein
MLGRRPDTRRAAIGIGDVTVDRTVPRCHLVSPFPSLCLTHAKQTQAMSRRMALRRAGGLFHALCVETPLARARAGALPPASSAPLASAPLVRRNMSMLPASAAALLATQVRCGGTAAFVWLHVSWAPPNNLAQQRAIHSTTAAAAAEAKAPAPHPGLKAAQHTDGTWPHGERSPTQWPSLNHVVCACPCNARRLLPVAAGVSGGGPGCGPDGAAAIAPSRPTLALVLTLVPPSVHSSRSGRRSLCETAWPTQWCPSLVVFSTSALVTVPTT